MNSHQIFTLDDLLTTSRDNATIVTTKNNDEQCIDGNNNTNDDNHIEQPTCSGELVDSNGSSQINSTKNNASKHNKYKQSLDYLKELFSDRERLHLIPFGTFSHMDRLLEQEIQRVRASLIHIDGSADQRQQLVLPKPEGDVVQISNKVFVPVDKYPDYNFVGRIIGPRGLTIRELEVDCGCKLYIRGKGSLRDKTKEEKLRGQGNMDHLNEELHVLITVEDTENRAKLKLERAVSQINKLFESVISNQDEFKFRQLAELAILNDKFNPNMKQPSLVNTMKENPLTSMLKVVNSTKQTPNAQTISHLSTASMATLAATGATTGATFHAATNPAAIHAFNSMFGAQTFPPTVGYETLLASQLNPNACSNALLTGAEVPLVHFTPYTALASVPNASNRFHPYKKK